MTFTDMDIDSNVTTNSVEVYGKAVFEFTGAGFVQKSWVPARSADGNDLPEDEDGIPTPRVFSFSTNQIEINSVVRYSGLAWPDVIAAAKEANKALKPPEDGQPDNRTDEQMFIALILSAFV